MAGTDEIGEHMNGKPKHVVSSTLRRLEWNNAHVFGGDLVAEIAKLREAHGGAVLVNGSAQLAHALVDHDFVDEYRRTVFPCVLALAESRPLGNDGVSLLSSRPKARS